MPSMISCLCSQSLQTSSRHLSRRIWWYCHRCRHHNICRRACLSLSQRSHEVCNFVFFLCATLCTFNQRCTIELLV
jgi:hypothetical protein